MINVIIQNIYHALMAYFPEYWDDGSLMLINHEITCVKQSDYVVESDGTAHRIYHYVVVARTKYSSGYDYLLMVYANDSLNGYPKSKKIFDLGNPKFDQYEVAKYARKLIKRKVKPITADEL